MASGFDAAAGFPGEDDRQVARVVVAVGQARTEQDVNVSLSRSSCTDGKGCLDNRALAGGRLALESATDKSDTFLHAEPAEI